MWSGSFVHSRSRLITRVLDEATLLCTENALDERTDAVLRMICRMYKSMRNLGNSQLFMRSWRMIVGKDGTHKK